MLVEDGRHLFQGEAERDHVAHTLQEYQARDRAAEAGERRALPEWLPLQDPLPQAPREAGYRVRVKEGRRVHGRGLLARVPVQEKEKEAA